MDHVFHHAGEVKDDLGLPLLGHIPHVEFFKGVREDKRFLLKELDKSVNSKKDPDTAKQRRYQRFFIRKPSATFSPPSASSTAISRCAPLHSPVRCRLRANR